MSYSQIVEKYKMLKKIRKEFKTATSVYEEQQKKIMEIFGKQFIERLNIFTEHFPIEKYPFKFQFYRFADVEIRKEEDNFYNDVIVFSCDMGQFKIFAENKYNIYSYQYILITNNLPSADLIQFQSFCNGILNVFDVYLEKNNYFSVLTKKIQSLETSLKKKKNILLNI